MCILQMDNDIQITLKYKRLQNVSSIQQALLHNWYNIEERVVIKLPLRALFAESSDQLHVGYKIT